jgi:hypothetical protein
MTPAMTAGTADVRRSMLVAGAAVLVAGAGVAVLVGATSDGAPPTAPTDTTGTASDGAAASLTDVVRTDLARAEELDGTIGHGEARPLVLAAGGTLTALPTAGDVVEPVAPVAEVDGRPILAVSGAFPFWRSLGSGVDDGKDVLQLEYLLATLGYAQTHDVTVDEEWTAATTEAVEDFQADHGQDDDGVVDLGELVVVDGAFRVAGVNGSVGQQANEAGITITPTERSVSVDLDVADADLLAVGDQVDVELASGEVVTATVTEIGAAETAGEGGGATLPVTLALDAATDSALDLPDGTPVTVRIEVVAATGVLAVPVEAVLALAEGGYALEVSDGATTHLVPVELGPFADGLVAVEGDVQAGDQVVVP